MINFEKIRHKYEIIYLVLGTLVTITLLYLFYDFNPIIASLVIIATLIYIRLIQGQFLGNTLQVNNKHFYRLKQIIEIQSQQLGIKEPNLFIYQDPEPKAYTMGFTDPYSIVLSSSLIDGLSEDELNVIIAHELGHVKYQHSRLSSFISPAGNDIPGFSIIFGFWNRASEITSDHVALKITEDPRSLVTALTKISVGINLFKQIDEDELLKQSEEIKGDYFSKLGELLGTHPYTIKRIHNIIQWAKDNNIPYYKDGKMFCTSCGTQITTSAKYCPKCGNSSRS